MQCNTISLLFMTARFRPWTSHRCCNCWDWGRNRKIKCKPCALFLVGWQASRHVHCGQVSNNTNRQWWGETLKPIIDWTGGYLCRITFERFFCPLIKRRWMVKIRNGYWSMVALSAPTLMTRQCNLIWSRRCKGADGFSEYFIFIYTVYIISILLSCIHRQSISCLWLDLIKFFFKMKKRTLQNILQINK